MGCFFLRRHEPTPADLPFAYQFEADGDLDITLNGMSYELDSPYDRDSKIKKKSTSKKKIKKKSTTRKKR